MWTITTNHDSLRSDLITKFLQFRPEEIFRVTIFTAYSAKSRNSRGKSLRVSSIFRVTFTGGEECMSDAL